MEEIIIQSQLLQSDLQLDVQDKFCDVILQINDVRLYCHRFILAAFSPFFRSKFEDDVMESEPKLIELEKIETQIAKDIIYYMYGKELKITVNNAESLAVAASTYYILPIVDACCTILSENINIENFVERYQFAKTNQPQQINDSNDPLITADIKACNIENFVETYQSAEMYQPQQIMDSNDPLITADIKACIVDIANTFQKIIDAIYQFMISDFKACTKHSNFHLISPAMIERCLQSSELHFSNEVDLLYILESWYHKHQPKCDDKTFIKIFENIHVPTIPEEDLSKFEQYSKFNKSINNFDLLNKVKGFYITPERHFSKLCALTYRHHTDGFQNIIKSSIPDTQNAAKNMPEIKINDKILNYGFTYMNVEAINRIYYAAVSIGHKLFLMGGMTEGICINC